MSVRVNKELLKEIGSLQLSERNVAWRKAMKAAGWHISAERERWTVKSWRETEGEDIQIRRAKLAACVLDNIPITIFPFDEIVGRPTTKVVGACTAIDISGDYIPDIWNEDGVVGATLDASARMSDEELEVLRESARTFRGHTMADMLYKTWEDVAGSWARDAEAAKLKDPSLDAGITQQSTSTLAWPKILRVGLKGYIEECRQCMDKFIAEQKKDFDKYYFWESAIIVLEAIIRYANRYAALAREMAAAEADAEQKAHLLKIAEVCEYVPENPARNFHEALQAMQFCNLSKMLENPQQNNCQWGRADQYLYPFFMNDIENDVPLERLASLYADIIGRWGTQMFIFGASQKESHQVNFGISNMMIGGLGADNDDKSNELSYLSLHIVALLKLSSPTVCMRCNSKTPDWIMRKAIDTNMETKGGIPLFESDEVVISHYIDAGIPWQEAVDWGGLGCVSPCLPTRIESYGTGGVAAFNLAGILHLVLHNGIDINGKQTGIQTGDPRKFRSFEDIYEAFLKQHKYICNKIFWLGAIARDQAPKYLRLPVLSILGIEKSVDLGHDFLFTDPEYSLLGLSDRAIIDVADSLTAINELVYKQEVLTLPQLLDVLDSNFEGEEGERIRQMCLMQPKYGNDIPEADEMVHRISNDSADIVHSYDNTPYRRYYIGREGLSWHYFGGLGVGALPNGRKALEPLNDGSLSPMRGADKNGPTAVLRSACAACFNEDSYASVLNQKFSASLLKSDESKEKLMAYTKAYLKNGGSHIQYNIVDTAELKDAKIHPENYQDLIVRIGGFSAYFVQLSSAIQDDVILRSEFSL